MRWNTVKLVYIKQQNIGYHWRVVVILEITYVIKTWKGTPKYWLLYSNGHHSEVWLYIINFFNRQKSNKNVLQKFRCSRKWNAIGGSSIFSAKKMENEESIFVIKPFYESQRRTLSDLPRAVWAKDWSSAKKYELIQIEHYLSSIKDTLLLSIIDNECNAEKKCGTTKKVIFKIKLDI